LDIEEKGTVPRETKIIIGPEAINGLLFSFIQRAGVKEDSLSSYIYAVTDNRSPEDPEPLLTFTRQMMMENPNFRILTVADIQKENLDYYKAILKLGIEVRHIDKNKVVFLVSKEEYITADADVLEKYSKDIPQAIWSNNPDVVTQATQIFQMMWRSAVPAEARIRQLEEGIDLGETRLMNDMTEVYQVGQKLIDDCKDEVLIILSSEKTITRNISLFQRLAERQTERGFKIRILAPISGETDTGVLPSAEWQDVRLLNVTLFIFDRSKMLLMQYTDVNARITESAAFSNIISASKQTISGMISVFEALWEESRLREREERARKQSELLQDILSHDIRNYNQISRMGAELLKARVEQLQARASITREDIQSLNTDVQFLTHGVVQAIDGSTQLVDKAKKLGKIISDRNPVLDRVDLLEPLRQSLALVKSTHSEKEIHEIFRADEGKAEVLADEFLDEVFVNILSNAVRYTESTNVPIEI
jgi:signal transduction histidine kinase